MQVSRRINVGKLDRAIRVILGSVLLLLWFFDPGNLLLLIGLLPVVTGVISFCPVYRLFGITTCPVPPNPFPPSRR